MFYYSFSTQKCYTFGHISPELAEGAAERILISLEILSSEQLATFGNS